MISYLMLQMSGKFSHDIRLMLQLSGNFGHGIIFNVTDVRQIQP